MKLVRTCCRRQAAAAAVVAAVLPAASKQRTEQDATARSCCWDSCRRANTKSFTEQTQDKDSLGGKLCKDEGLGGGGRWW